MKQSHAIRKNKTDIVPGSYTWTDLVKYYLRQLGTHFYILSNMTYFMFCLMIIMIISYLSLLITQEVALKLDSLIGDVEDAVSSSMAGKQKALPVSSLEVSFFLLWGMYREFR